MTRRVFWLVAGLALLTFWCGLSFVLLSGGYEVFPVLIWFLGLLFFVAAFVSPDPAQHEPVGEVPSASPTDELAEFEREFAEDAASRRTQLTEDGDS